MNQDWYEIWVDESPEVPYVLLLCPNKSNSKELLIIDPQEKMQLFKQCPTMNMPCYG